MSVVHFLKLRSNITLQGDIDLAVREVSSLYGKVVIIKKPKDVIKYLQIPRKLVIHNSRHEVPIGLVGIEPKLDLSSIAKSLSFVQEIWFFSNEIDKIPKGDWWLAVPTKGGNLVCALPLMAAAEILTYMGGEVSPGDLPEIIRALSQGDESNPKVRKAICRMLTSTPHVHGIHRYKAKFFPRMIRSFLVSTLRTVPEQTNKGIVLLDPFVGSGTALVEASLLGIKSIGIDIDPLSCEISRAKIDLMNLDTSLLRESVSDLRTNIEDIEKAEILEKAYSFPPWIARKFNPAARQGKHHYTPEQKKQLEREIAIVRKAINNVKSEELRRVFEVCLSDAISRKLNIRMLGTGVGRFALEMREAKLSRLINTNLSFTIRASSVCSVLKNSYGIKLATSKVINGTATDMHLKEGAISVILTSPPYLPASSGRENYLVSKSISITALGLMTSKQILESEALSIGSMQTNGSVYSNKLPKEVFKLYSWLKSDELRSIKAEPIVAYYHSLMKALQESYRVLLRGGIAIYVIGKESLFYNFSTRKVLYRVACDKIFEKIAKSCGFTIDAKVDVQLDKKNTNARPRSLDTFYETIFVMRK